jgi:signal transduction histidine kinase
MSTPLRVLLVEDSPHDAGLILREIHRGGYEPICRRVDDPREMSAALAEQAWDVVIAEANLPRMNAVEALTLLKETGLDLPIIIVAGSTGEEAAASAMKAGAHDCIVKDNLARLVPAIARELGEAANRADRLRVEELAKRTDELQRANLEMETFLYTVSHDLKAPLVTLHAMTEMLLASGGEWMGEKEQHYLNRMRANVAHMQRLVEDLLDMARLGRTQQRIERFDVEEVMKAAIELLAGPIASKGAEIIVPDRLGRTRYDRHRLLQVAANLLSNALQYSHPDRAPRVEIKGKLEQDALVIEIRDNGIGIEERDFDRIFQVFEKVSPGEGEGSGMGLSIVKKIVEMYGGRIWVQSSPGEGSAFYFTVPGD